MNKIIREKYLVNLIRISLLIHIFTVLTKNMFIYWKHYFLNKFLSWFWKQVLKNCKNNISQYFACDWRKEIKEMKFVFIECSSSIYLFIYFYILDT